MSDAVLAEKSGHVLTLTINRPDKRNAMNADVIAGLTAGWRQADADPDIRAIVLTGAGDKAFCAGADLGGGQSAFQGAAVRITTDYADLLRLTQNSTTPSIARINGACMAGGMGLMAMTDMAVAVDTAPFGLPEVKVGVFPMQVLSVLQMLVPRRVLAEWCITGEPFSAAEAREVGLINHVVPAAELDAKVAWLLGRLTDKSPTAIRRGKYAMRAIHAMSFDEAIAFTEGQIALTAASEDAREGIAAFQEKRKPVWTGR